MTVYQDKYNSIFNLINTTKAETLAVMHNIKPCFNFSNLDFTIECHKLRSQSLYSLTTIIPNSSISVLFHGTKDEVVIKTKVILKWAASIEGQEVINQIMKKEIEKNGLY